MRLTAPSLLAVTIALALAGCATRRPEPAPPDDLYLGSGHGQTLGEAMNAAKIDAVRKAVIELIGAEAEVAYARELDEVLYSTRNPNAYVYNDTMETLRREGSLIEGDLRYEIRIRVNVPAVRRTLEANRISSSVPPGHIADASPEGGAQASDGLAIEVIPAAEYPGVSLAQRRFIARYVDRMTYMVYFADRAAHDLPDGEFLLRSAVNQANAHLVSRGRLVVDASQVEQLKRDHELVYEEQVGRELSLLQWVARRLNADVYLELDARASTRRSGTGYTAAADVTLSMYETSTGQILGSVNRRSQESFSRTGEADAVTNALQSAVYQAMPHAIEMAERQMERMLTRGIRYEVIVQRPPDARTLSLFRTAMRDEVRDISTVSQSPQEIVYEVFLVGDSDDLVDLVFAVSERVAGFENIDLVIGRGQSLTFDAGY